MEEKIELNFEELEKQVKKEYYRKWRAEHKENIKRHNQNYWRKKALIAAHQNKEE